MSEDLYAKVDITKKVRFQTAEKEDTNADDNGNIDNVTIYDNAWAEGGTPPKSQDNTAGDQRQQTTSVNVSSGQRNLFKDAAAVFLGLLCLVLLAAVLVLVVLWIQDKNNWGVKNEKLTSEKDKLLIRCRDEKSLNDNLTLKTSKLQAMINNVTNETDRLQTIYSELQILSYNMTVNISESVAMINNLTNERDRLQTIYRELKNLSDNMNQNISMSMAMINDLTNERDKLKKALLESVWMYFSGSLYYNSSVTKSWNQSRDDCQQRGADLVIINSKEEQDFIRSFQKQMWIGLSDNETEGTWKWVDGTLLDKSYWKSNEPNHILPDEDCAAIWKSDSEKNWYDDPCDRKNYWMCEKRLP